MIANSSPFCWSLGRLLNWLYCNTNSAKARTLSDEFSDEFSPFIWWLPTVFIWVADKVLPELDSW
jgi:hypothetical protein